MSMRECSPIDALSDILMDVPDLVFAYGADQRYLFINRAAAEFLDADPLDVIGCTWRELGYSEAVMGPLMGAVSEVYETGEPRHYTTRTSPERGNRLLDVSLTPLRASDCGVIAVLAIGHDVTSYVDGGGSR